MSKLSVVLKSLSFGLKFGWSAAIVASMLLTVSACSAKFGDPDDDNVPEVTDVEIGNDEPIECPREDKQRGVC